MFVEDQTKSKEFTVSKLPKSKTNPNPAKEVVSSKSGAISRVAFDLEAQSKSPKKEDERRKMLVENLNPKSEARSEVRSEMNLGIYSQEVVFKEKN